MHKPSYLIYVGLIHIALLAACQQPAPSAAPAKECGPTAPVNAQATGATSSFVAEVPQNTSAEITTAINAGRALESVSQQSAIFDQQIRTIAKDAKLTEEWSKVTKTTESSSSTTHVAVDLPQQINKLRAIGVTNEEITHLIDSSIKQGISTQDLTTIVTITAKSAEEKGPIEDVGYYLIEKIETGTQTKTLIKEVQEEHKTRGSKVQKEEIAKGKKAVICHKPPGNRPNMKTLEVGASAVRAHLAHGDSEGPCEKGEGGGKGEGGTVTIPGEGGTSAVILPTPDHGGGKPDDKGKPDDSTGGKPDDKGKPDDSVGGKPDDKGKPDDNGGGKPDDKGKPDDNGGGKPDDKGKPDKGGNDKGGGKGKGK